MHQNDPSVLFECAGLFWPFNFKHENCHQQKQQQKIHLIDFSTEYETTEKKNTQNGTRKKVLNLNRGQQRKKKVQQSMGSGSSQNSFVCLSVFFSLLFFLSFWLFIVFSVWSAVNKIPQRMFFKMHVTKIKFFQSTEEPKKK